MYKFSFLLNIFSLIYCFTAEAQTAKPNILLILTDDLGYHDVSYYGTKDIRTPNIDQICKAGMRFDNFYSNSPVCSPTRASLMTGRYPDYVGVPGLIRSNPSDNWGYLDPSAILLPAILKKAGYHTALIGKWNLGLESPNLPNEKGFDLFHGWLEDMMEDYTIKRRSGKNYMRLNQDSIDPKGHATDVFTAWSVEYIRERGKQQEPFFLFLSYNAPHFPVQPPQDYIDKVKKREPGISETRAKLVAFIEQTDDAIGKVIATLKETGQYENTLIIFTSDNGGHLPTGANNGPVRDGKQSMYEGGLRVPAFVSWPKVIQSGTVSQQVDLSMDIFPTLAELAGVKIEHRIEGRSFFPTLKGMAMNDADRVLYFTRREGGPYGGKAYHAIRQGDWKLLQNSPYQPMELYNLKEDPLEKNDLIRSNPDVYKKLNGLLMQHIQEGGKVPWQKR
jgi:arylsulfatase A-like enzyme